MTLTRSIRTAWGRTSAATALLAMLLAPQLGQAIDVACPLSLPAHSSCMQGTQRVTSLNRSGDECNAQCDAGYDAGGYPHPLASHISVVCADEGVYVQQLWGG